MHQVNRFVAGSQYDVSLDGARVATLDPGESHTRDVASGSHTIVFYFAGSHDYGCSPAHPNLAQCSTQEFSCSTDE